QYFYSGDGALAFLLVRPLQHEKSFTGAARSVAALRAIVSDVRAQYAGLDFGVTGLPVLENDEMTAAQNDTRLASWLAIAAISLLFLVVYRSVCYPAVTVATLLVGTAWAMGWLTLTVGHLNILSATFAVMLIGMGDYGVLWVMRYEQARRRGLGVLAALQHTTVHVAIGNLTAATTLAMAFFAATFADFRAVAELGWIAGCGVLLCALACFTVLPALFRVRDRRGDLAAWERQRAERGWSPGNLLWPTPARSASAGTTPARSASAGTTPARSASAGRSSPRWRFGLVSDGGWLPVLPRRPGWVIAAGVLVTVALGVCAWRGISYDHNLLHLQAKDLDAVKWELKLIEHTAGASWHALSYVASP